MTAKPAALLLLLASAWFTGCNSVGPISSARTAAPYEPTALIIADESGPLTADELAAHRPAIVAYLVRRGYVETPDAIVDNPAMASRFIRVIVYPGGGFRITEFTLGNRARQVITTGFFPSPGHSDDYSDYGRYGYYSYLYAVPDHPRADPGPSTPPSGYQPPPETPRPAEPRVDGRPRRYERRINPEGRGSGHGPRESTRRDDGGSGSSPSPSSPPPSYTPPEPRAASGEARYEQLNRPHDP